MAATVLKRILMRFRRVDFKYIVQNWEPLSKGWTDVDVEEIKKVDFVDAVMQKFKHKDISQQSIAQLDLLYLQRYPNTKLWKVMKVGVIPDNPPSGSSTVADFQRTLKKEITSYLDAHVHCIEHHHTYWIRIAIEGYKGLPDVVYITHLPNTNYLMINGLKAKHKSYIIQSLLTVLNGHSLIDCHLSGRSLISLMRLVLSKHSKGASISLGGSPRPVREASLPDNVYNENHLEKRVRDDFVDENFGPTKLPRLEKIVYKLDTKFKGVSHVPSMARHDRAFHCQVKFEGPSVLEGLRGLTMAGLVVLPMKGHLAQLHKMAKNEFYLTQK